MIYHIFPTMSFKTYFFQKYYALYFMEDFSGLQVFCLGEYLTKVDVIYENGNISYPDWNGLADLTNFS